MRYIFFWNINDANAQITTTASIMFQNSRRYEPGCKITPRSMTCGQIIGYTEHPEHCLETVPVGNFSPRFFLQFFSLFYL